MYGIVIILFQIDDKHKKSRILEETFLLVDICMDVAFIIPLLTWKNIEINFNNRKLSWRLYITAKVFPTTRQVELVRMKEFATTALDPKDEIFIVHKASFVISSPDEINAFGMAQ